MNKYNSLTPTSHAILKDKATEAPFTGPYVEKATQGTYLCKGCGAALFRAGQQFTSSCGWPSFDDELKDRVKQLPDADGRRTEILCAGCDGHLGHIFHGEHYTAKNTRYCVNGFALDFVEDENVIDTQEAILAAGCFWGVEYYLKQLPGVLLAESGYCGGEVANPSYEAVCSKKSGHLEAVRVIYDPNKLSYEALLKYFFEIHDFTQTNGQGPDLGPQYLSAVFYFDQQQNSIAEKVIQQLKELGYEVATQLLPASTFWPAEEYHQDYYHKTGKQPYCHTRRKVF